mgnify:FL=1
MMYCYVRKQLYETAHVGFPLLGTFGSFVPPTSPRFSERVRRLLSPAGVWEGYVIDPERLLVNGKGKLGKANLHENRDNKVKK